jgi:DNA-directed RNA polymerase subunit alpha
MVYDIILPSKPKIILEKENAGIFEIDSLYPGYGITVGNSLRRVLLSSLPGAAVTSVKIKGVDHEFSTLSGVLEDVITILLNVKKLRFRMHGDEPQKIELTSKGQKVLTGKDLTVPSNIEVMNGDEHLVTLTDKESDFHMELIVEKGLGYVPRELAHKEKVEIGMMTLDALFSPVKKVNFEIEDMRVGDRTDYNRIRFHIETDGSISPREAFLESVGIITRQFDVLRSGFATSDDESPSELEAALREEMRTSEDISGGEDSDVSKVKIEDLRLSSRTINALHEAGIKTIGGLMRRDADSLSTIPGVGDKAIQEIKRALGSMGMTLK